VKVLVTGGAGYLGSILVKRLAERFEKVIVYDAMLYGNAHLSNTGADIVVGDVSDTQTLGKLIPSVDAVVHLAAIVGDQAGDIDKENTIKVNYFATRNLADLCRRMGKRLIYTSTCSVYGAQKNVLTEESEVLPLSVYALTKLAAEDAVRNYCEDYVILRLGTLHGLSPRMRFDLVINRFIAQAIQDGKIAVFGGEQYRPFLHVRDAAEAIVKCLESDIRGTYNLGGQNMKIIDVANEIKNKTGCKGKGLL